MQEQKYKGWTIIVDCDGCLTNGQKYVDHLGNRQLIAFHSRDSIASKALVEIGFQVIVVTMSTFDGITNYWKRHGAHTVIAWGRDKIEALATFGIDWEKTIGIGDDITDLCYLEKCKIAICPKDANFHVKYTLAQMENGNVSKMKGGKGMLSAIHNLIVNAQYLEEYAN